MLADIGDTKRLDSEWESESVSIVLGDLRLPPIGAPSPETLREYIELSGDSQVYFDALEHMYEVLDNRGQAMPRQLRKWRQGAGGGRGRPAKKRAPSQRPVTLATLLRHLQIQVTIEILRMVGVPPSGTDVSGCRIVSEVLRELADGGLVPKALGLARSTSSTPMVQYCPGLNVNGTSGLSRITHRSSVTSLRYVIVALGRGVAFLLACAVIARAAYRATFFTRTGHTLRPGILDIGSGSSLS